MNSDLEAWLIARVAADAGLDPALIDAGTPLYRFGIDSRTLAFIVENAESRFDLAADLDLISPAETIRTLLSAFTPPS